MRNPATGQTSSRGFRIRPRADIDRGDDRARGPLLRARAWGGMDVRGSRARLINRLADAFEANLETLYRLETLNNGRPINETRAQLARLPDFFRYFAGRGAGTAR